MSKYLYSDIGIVILVLMPGLLWLVGGYWQTKLIRRINVVAVMQHRVPGNVFWMKRARMAIEADDDCQKMVRKRNIAAVAFIVVLFCEAALLAITRMF